MTLAWPRPVAHLRRGGNGNAGRYYDKNVANPNKENTKHFVTLMEQFAQNKWDKPLVRVYGGCGFIVC